MNHRDFDAHVALGKTADTDTCCNGDCAQRRCCPRFDKPLPSPTVGQEIFHALIAVGAVAGLSMLLGFAMAVIEGLKYWWSTL